MTDTKTEYLSILEQLKEAYMACFNEFEGDKTVRKLSLLIALFEGGEYFETVNTGLKDKLVIDIDRDVDYLAWGNPAMWTAFKKKAEPDSASQKNKTLARERDEAFANRLTDMLPPRPLNDPKRTEGLTYTELEKFKDTINNLINPHVFSDQMMDFAIDAALKKLCKALCSIRNTIGERHTIEKYEKLYKSVRNHYITNGTGPKVANEYEEWKASSIDEEISEIAYVEHAKATVVDLLKSGVIDHIIGAGFTKQQKAEYCQEIDFDDYNFPPDKNPAVPYSRFRSIYRYSDGKYQVDPQKAGRLMFNLRKKTDLLEAFFRHDHTLKLIIKDINTLRAAHAKTAGEDDIAPQCRFSAEQIKSSGIAEKHAHVVLAIMDSMVTTNTKKSYWFCFYSVLLEKKWIEENVRGFCTKMKNIFGVGLDQASMNQNKKEMGTIIEKWNETDTRNKGKKAFAIQFKNAIDDYYEKKRESVKPWNS